MKNNNKMNVKVSNVVVKDLSPKVDPKYRHLLPQVLKAKSINFRLTNVSNAVANAIRRTVGMELRVKCMVAEYADVETNDAFPIGEMILKRLRLIPIDQKTPLNTTFHLDFRNESYDIAPVRTTDIKGKQVFNSHVLLYLEPGKTFKIKKIKIGEDYGYNDAAFSVAHHCTSLAVDQKPMNRFIENDDGISSSVSNPRVWDLYFKTNGSAEPKTIVRQACENLIERVKTVSQMLSMIESSNDEYLLTIAGESDTIGNLFMKTICDLYPDIKGVTYSTETFVRQVTIRVRCNEDIITVYETAIAYLVGVFGDIQKQIGAS